MGAKIGGIPRIGVERVFAMTDDNNPPKQDDFDARLRRAREGGEPSRTKGDDAPSTSAQGFGLAFRIGTEMVAALAVSVFIGYLLDLWLGTKPWLMVVFFFLGSAAGILNVYRASQGIGLAPGYKDNPLSEGRSLGVPPNKRDLEQGESPKD